MTVQLRTKLLPLLAIGLLTVGGGSVPARAANQIRATIGNQQVSVPLDDLERFGDSGEVSERLAPVAQALGAPAVSQLQRLLVTRLTIAAAEVEQLSTTPVMQPLLRSLAQVGQRPAAAADEAAWRSALVQAASEAPDGWTALDALRQFPGEMLQVDLVSLKPLLTELETAIGYREAAIKAIAQAAAQEAATSTVTTGPELRSPGPNAVETLSFVLQIQRPRLSATEPETMYYMPVTLYLPQGNTEPVPLVVLSHGFGATRANYAYLAEHLASHGLAVAAPEHVGNGFQYRDLFLNGPISSIVQPLEYVSRPLEITYLLNALEGFVNVESRVRNRINLQQIGILGNSLGGTTALSLAGAAFNLDRLRQQCTAGQIHVSLSVPLQCIAQTAPLSNLNLSDRRIKAVLAANPLTSEVFGPEGMAQISVPTLIVAASQDAITSVVQDQIQAFLGLQIPDKYLALMDPGTHFSTSNQTYVSDFPSSIRGDSSTQAQAYLNALSVAFFGAFLNEDPLRSRYQSALSAAYVQSINQDPLRLYLIRSLSPAQLEQPYGGSPPFSIAPAQE